MIFSGEEAAWRARVIRELRTGSHVYIVIRAPQNPDTSNRQESVQEIQ
ncbi:MAG: hypothetical protein GQ528_07725 [Woeseiaceae bacterium]|nr:hypothetical protein [Woeseiaceae bacterium]